MRTVVPTYVAVRTKTCGVIGMISREMDFRIFTT
jgi:hypothetical protein